jgi:endoglucanase
MFDLIKTLTEMSGPVGQEDAVVDYVETLWQQGGATTERTKLNNLLAHVGGQGPKVLLVAHADELCYLVRSIDEGGFLWLANGQGWQRTTSFRNGFTIGQRVRVLARTGELPGVITAVTGHLATIASHEPHELNWNDFWVDTGLSKAELLARGVTPGTRIIWDATTERFGPHVVGKALDDRVLLAVLTELLKRIKPDELGCQLTLGCSVQEEIGVIGAFSIAAHSSFDYAVALEIGMADDIPMVSSHAVSLRLGSGPVLVHKDALVHYHHGLTAHLERVADDAHIPIQHAVFGSFGSDGSALMKADIPSALVAFPARYTHTPFETAHLGDIEALVDWIEAFVKSDFEMK